MTGNSDSVEVNIKVRVPEDLRASAGGFLHALSIIDKLYGMEIEGRVSGSITRASERRAWSDIIGSLSGCTDTLPKGGGAGFEESLRFLKGGIYDLYPLAIKSEEDPGGGVELVLGKVFLSSGGGASFYSGCAGALNDKFDGLIRIYDERMPDFAARLGSLTGGSSLSVPESIPELKCIDVFSLSGGLNTRHKPICVFFSGGARENVSSLSNMTVFINLYVSRFRAITKKIADGYLPWAGELFVGLGSDDIARLLLIWLRGHDVGHFFGADNLGKVMSEFDMDYMILHELKSDFVALHNLRYLGPEALGGLSVEQTYAASVSEMFRYIRRGGIYKHPDSGSAYLTYMALIEEGALEYDRGSGQYSFDRDKFEKAVLKHTAELLNLFSKGSAADARAYVNRWGELQDSDEMGVPKSCPEELFRLVQDTDIARFIEYSFEI